MGTLSLSKTGRLFWLGRYTERVYTVLRLTRPIREAEIDGQEADYTEYCRCMGIPAGYADTADFCRRYFFDAEDPVSVAASLGFAYDNAVVLRETLSSDTLAYIQLTMNAMEKAAHSTGPEMELQWVMDDVMAFRGSCEDTIDDEASRNIIKAGASLERVDLYLRLGCGREACEKEFARLFNRLYKTQLRRDEEKLRLLANVLLDKTLPDPGAWKLVAALEGVFPEV